MCDIVDFGILPHSLPLDGNLRVSRRWASVHRILEWGNHRPYRILCFQAATSCGLSSSLRCSSLIHLSGCHQPRDVQSNVFLRDDSTHNLANCVSPPIEPHP